MVRDPSKPLGAAEYVRPAVEVGGKLACTNLREIRMELVHALKAGFKKRELLVFRQHDGRCKMFFLAGFCARFIDQEPDMVGELLERGQWLAEHGLDRDMLYVSVVDKETRRYEIGVLDQPTRRVHSTPNWRGNRAARRAAKAVN